MKIAVLGLGSSLALYKPEEFELSIGVNDIWRHHHTEVIVCLDKFAAFTPDRLAVIHDSKPKAFYSQMVIWDTRPDFRKINFHPGYPDRLCTVDSQVFHKSFCSPFVACQVAFWNYGATEIHVFGVDLVNHPHLDAPLCGRIKTHFKHLKAALVLKGCQLIIHGEGILKDI